MEPRRPAYTVVPSICPCCPAEVVPVPFTRGWWEEIASSYVYNREPRVRAACAYAARRAARAAR